MPGKWSEQEIRELKRLVRTRISTREIARRLGRSFDGVQTKLYKLDRFGQWTNRITATRWTDAEDAVIARMVGKYLVSEIAQAILDECGMRRSDHAVKARIWKHHGAGTWPDPEHYMTTPTVARLLGLVDKTNVIRWIRSGLLSAQKIGTVNMISRADLETFIDAHPMRFDASAMPPSWARRKVEMLQRAGGWVSIREAAQVLGVHRSTVKRIISAMGIDTTTGRRGQVGGASYWIRRADLNQMIAAREGQAA